MDEKSPRRGKTRKIDKQCVIRTHDTVTGISTNEKTQWFSDYKLLVYLRKFRKSFKGIDSTTKVKISIFDTNGG